MPIEAHETALYTTLSTNAGLITALGGTLIYNQRAPQSPGDKYVIFQWQGGGYENESPHETLNVLYAVLGVATTRADAAALDTAVKSALHNATLTVTGWTPFWCAREDHISFVQADSSGVDRYHAGAVYRIRSDAS